ncbi:G10 protein [Pseudoloma neurophilia]|uniref:G10 protein n=1 Tax=Pseudoloma neurophilia TaxID=146866 RepID=A0A0R0LZV5_9MICR|nr:G10 protein [Pseudoloma neurophilia]
MFDEDLAAEFKTIKEEFEEIKSSNPYQLVHLKSRFIIHKFSNCEISAKLYNFLCKTHQIDLDLIILWTKQGYENLCCTICTYTGDKKDGKVCICRVPKKKFEKDSERECTICKCMGCGG